MSAISTQIESSCEFDSELVHAEVVKPALLVLRQKGFASAQAEFLAAHEHYRSGRNSEALVEALKGIREHDENHLHEEEVEL